MRSLEAYLNDRRIGTLSEGNDLWRFEYDAAWVEAADSFDLSPTLRRAQRVHSDGGSERPVQWYFDNLLPEENLREVVSKEANIKGDDAFALLEYLGAESAGSLVLVSPGKSLHERRALQARRDEELCQRIEIDEYLVMKLAFEVGLRVPSVFRRYTPEPIYIVERFDRYVDKAGLTQRLHVIDACQLLNKSRLFKYKSATLQTLADIVTHCRNRASARQRLYLWLVFNLLLGNHDNHLKNLSFMVSNDGIELSPAYDLLSTAAYHTRVFAGERENRPAVELAIPLPDAPTFGAVTRQSVLSAGEALGLTKRISARELDRMVNALPGALDKLVASIATENADRPETVRRFLGGEDRLMRTIQRVVLPEMLKRVGSG
jgi:serine/threonine-protein kinase HipA